MALTIEFNAPAAGGNNVQTGRLRGRELASNHRGTFVKIDVQGPDGLMCRHSVYVGVVPEVFDALAREAGEKMDLTQRRIGEIERACAHSSVCPR